MKSNQLICEIQWDRVPLVSSQKDARTWLGFQACRGLALNTLDAYGRNLERYLRFLNKCNKQPHEITQEVVGAYLSDLVKASATPEGPDVRMANATIQQHLAALRMFYDFLVEEGRCTRNPYRHGEGRSSRSLVKREHKLPPIPTEEEWCRVLSEAAKEPIRNRLMLAMSYDAGLRREELCLLETHDIDPSRRTIRARRPEVARQIALAKTPQFHIKNRISLIGFLGNDAVSHSSQGLTAERVLVNADTGVHPDLLNSRFGYVSISRASHEATVFTDDVNKLSPQLSADVSKTSALEINHTALVAQEIGVGMGI